MPKKLSPLNLAMKSPAMKKAFQASNKKKAYPAFVAAKLKSGKAKTPTKKAGPKKK